ncbi:MAG: rRNA pseudouridine synthase [Ignavibacteria bacterium]|nr:rRNA pseudouridine synthase [Ignavibacteria bacterium]
MKQIKSNSSQDYVRINKFIASNTKLSRRKVDEYILQGRVTINNITISDTGFKINPERDKIRVDGELIKQSKKKVYILLNKPQKTISSVSDDKGRVTVVDLIKIKEKIFPVGRLDYDTSGALILTNDGEFANKIMHPSFKIPKTYELKLSKPLEEKHKDYLTRGILLEGKKTAPSKIEFLSKDDKRKIRITIIEGRNRQVKKMFEKFGYKIYRLHRSKIGTISLGNLNSGEWRYLTTQEVSKIESLVSTKK